MGFDIDSFYYTFLGEEKYLFEKRGHLFAEQLLIFFRKMLRGDDKKEAILELRESIGTEIDQSYVDIVTEYPIEYVYEIIDLIVHSNEISTSLQGINVHEIYKFADRLNDL